MWRLLNKSSDCRLFCEHLEASGGGQRSSATLEDFLAALSPALRAHHANCEACRRTASDFFASRTLLLRAPVSSVVPGPWFTSEVMNAIGAREVELARAAGAWTAIPKYAARLAFVAFAAILIVSTMLLEKPSATRSAAVADPSQESLFENSPPPMTHDEILLSLAERTQ